MSEQEVAPDAARLLVTGADGFVGRGVVAAAMAQGWRVGAALRQDRGRLPASVTRHAVGDIADPAVDWARALDGTPVVVHLAGAAATPSGPDAVGALRRLNVEATVRLARACARAGVRRLVHVSSVKVLGESTAPGVPFDDASPPDPRDAYARSKLEAENALASMHDPCGLQIVIVRPPLVYGPGGSGNLARLGRWIAAGRPLPLGAVDNRRSLIGLHNLADALLCASTHPAAAGRRLLVADGQDLSTPELCRLLGQAVGRPPRLWDVPPRLLAAAARLDRSGTLRRLVTSLQVRPGVLRDQLGWEPVCTLPQGMGVVRCP